MRVFSANPENVLLVRGNHEERRTWAEYSFKLEVSRKFPGKQNNVDMDRQVYKMFTLFCERLPHAVFMACDPQDAPATEEVNGKGAGKLQGQVTDRKLKDPDGQQQQQKGKGKSKTSLA